MNLESPKVTVAQPASYIFNALTKVSNFEKLMPENTAKFEVIGEDAFIFGLKGMPEIKLKLKSTTPDTNVLLGAASDKLPFTLEAKSKASVEPILAKKEDTCLFAGRSRIFLTVLSL